MPVVLLTARGLSDDRIAGYSAGASSCGLHSSNPWPCSEALHSRPLPPPLAPPSPSCSPSPSPSPPPPPPPSPFSPHPHPHPCPRPRPHRRPSPSDRYVSKPFEPEELLAVVNAQLTNARLAHDATRAKRATEGWHRAGTGQGNGTRPRAPSHRARYWRPRRRPVSLAHWVPPECEVAGGRGRSREVAVVSVGCLPPPRLTTCARAAHVHVACIRHAG